MSSSTKKSASTGSEKISASEDQQAMVNEVRGSLGTLSDKFSIYCSDTTIQRYLMARNWHVKKATKMLKESLKWSSENKPEEIRWEEVAQEAETGKIYRSNYTDKHGRTVLVMRPSFENSKSTQGKIRYLCYCMENAVLNMQQGQEQMVWLIDFQGYKLSHVSVNVTRETAHVLQDRYPERLGLAILYNPPKFFESFWKIVKPFLDQKTRDKVKFVYSNDANTNKIMEDLFDMDQLESAFGGNNNTGFDITKYAERMREDDKRMRAFWTRADPSVPPQPVLTDAPSSDSVKLDKDSDPSDSEKANSSQSHGVESDVVSPDHNNKLADTGGTNPTEEMQ
ncbi:phosphatidylinositol transfer protein 3 [Morus notabilis]|uniref:phosphatidylinositol transfer protein 3 n=1 Tax=Morus notabilis TaxID=981085 RepID=UPI000CED6747|nr:phosphatidylinositol transfer protein 3 [Morus notabilis]